MKSIRMPSAALALCVAWSVEAAEHVELDLGANADGKPISFVACPVIQDTSAVPCWFAENEGVQYYLGIQQDIGAAFHPPQLNHQVLVEGRILEGVQLCGAPVIHPITISVLPEISRECNTILPAVPGIEPPPHERGPGPSNDGLAPREARVVPPAPQPPFTARQFDVLYTFDSTMMRGTVTQVISQAMNYARQIDASRIEVVAHRATSLLSDGSELVEMGSMAERRASALRTILTESGFDAALLDIRAENAPLRGDGTEDHLLRKVSITVHP